MQADQYDEISRIARMAGVSRDDVLEVDAFLIKHGWMTADGRLVIPSSTEEVPGE
jgi:hypothetical protein